MKKSFISIKNVAWLLLVLLVCFVAYVLVTKSHSDEKNVVEGDQPRKAALSVEVIQPSQALWAKQMQVSGTVYPWQEAVVSSEISGLRINKLLVDVGEQVKKGQPLVLLATETVAATLRKQEAMVARDQAQLAEAQSNAIRANEIKQSGALSLQKINQYMIAEQTAKANLALSQAELDSQKILMRQTRIVAPDFGIISSRTASLGQVVTAGSELFTFLRQNRIEWHAEVNTEQLQHIEKGQTVQISQGNQAPITGTVRMIAPLVDANSRNALVYVNLPKNSAKPGMYLSGKIDIGEQSAMTLPQSSIIMRDGAAYLFEVVHQDKFDLVIQRKVKTGRIQGTHIEVNQGADAQANYVLTGGAFLSDGDVVKVIDQSNNVQVGGVQ